MDAAAQQHWWELHLRVARGESLTPEERNLYEATLRQLDESERLPHLNDAKVARDNLHRHEAERARLEDLEDLGARDYSLTTADLDRIGPHHRPPASFYVDESKPF